MAKVVNPFFPKGIGCLKFKPQKNLKGGSTHVAFIKRVQKRKVVRKIG